MLTFSIKFMSPTTKTSKKCPLKAFSKNNLKKMNKNHFLEEMYESNTFLSALPPTLLQNIVNREIVSRQLGFCGSFACVGHTAFV